MDERSGAISCPRSYLKVSKHVFPVYQSQLVRTSIFGHVFLTTFARKKMLHLGAWSHFLWFFPALFYCDNNCNIFLWSFLSNVQPFKFKFYFSPWIFQMSGPFEFKFYFSPWFFQDLFYCDTNYNIFLWSFLSDVQPFWFISFFSCFFQMPSPFTLMFYFSPGFFLMSGPLDY